MTAKQPRFTTDPPDESGFFWVIKDGVAGVAEVEVLKGSYRVTATQDISLADILTKRVHWGVRLCPPEVPDRLAAKADPRKDDRYSADLSG